MTKTTQFYAIQITLLVIVAVFLIFVYPLIGLDKLSIAPYFNVATQQFPLKHQFFLEQFMHTGLKRCIVIIAMMSLLMAMRANFMLAAGTTFFSRIKILVKNNYFLAFIGMVASTAVVSILKNTSIHGCPHNLTVYGGNLPLLTLFSQLPAGIKAGHCFPGGHASGGFSLLSFYFVFKQSKPMLAKFGLYGGLTLGFAMGWAQMMRGEHFLSHNLWTAWVVWSVLLGLYAINRAFNQHHLASN